MVWKRHSEMSENTEETSQHDENKGKKKNKAKQVIGCQAEPKTKTSLHFMDVG